MPRILAVLLGLFGVAHAQPAFDASALQKQQRRSARELADAAVTRAEWNTAITLYEQWLALAPSDADGCAHLARCYAVTGRHADAVSTLRLALANDYQGDLRLERDDAWKGLFTTPQGREVRTMIDAHWAARADIKTHYTTMQRIGRYQALMPPNADPAKRYRMVLLLHGNGQRPEVMLRWARQLNIPDVIWVAPEAPYVKTHDVAASQREQYSAAGESLHAPDSLRDDIVRSSSAWYHSVIDDARITLPVTNDKPVVIGFSQGGFYAHVIATRYPEHVSSIVSICGSMYSDGDVTTNYAKLRTYGIPVLVLHGTKDETVPLQTGELIDAALTSAQVAHVYRPFNGGHWPTAEADQAIRSWLDGTLRP
jgi:predicted esterase